jgi:acyl-coenzyme A synthetase/AMP-(fatty) acid ligase
MNIVEPIFAQCRNKPSELALCAPGTEFNLVSYARLERSVNNICRRIIAAGIAARSRVGVVIDDPVLHAMVVIALTRLGVVTVSAGHRAVQWPIALDGAIADRQYESLSGKTALVDAAWAAGDDQPIAEKYLCRATPNDVCRIFLTTGNEGRQKAIAMTHGMIATRIDRQKLFFGPRAPFCDRTHLDLSLATPLGFQVMLGTLWRGGALVMTQDVRKTLSALAAYNIQNMVAEPQSLLKFAGALENNPGYRSNLAAVFSAGGLAAEPAARVRAHLCSNLTVGYVAGDGTMVASIPAQLGSPMSGAAGYVLPGVVVEIVDEQDCTVPVGQTGNLRIRSEYGIQEYLDDLSATQRAFRDGWFYTGERGHLTNDNVLVLASAAADDLATDAERVEEILSKHTNVMQCGVLAVASESGAQEFCALVMPRSYLDTEALRSYCQARLPAHLVPAGFIAVSDLPQKPDGSIDRAKLPELLKSQLN